MKLYQDLQNFGAASKVWRVEPLTTAQWFLARWWMHWNNSRRTVLRLSRCTKPLWRPMWFWQFGFEPENGSSFAAFWTKNDPQKSKRSSPSRDYGWEKALKLQMKSAKIQVCLGSWQSDWFLCVIAFFVHRRIAKNSPMDMASEWMSTIFSEGLLLEVTWFFELPRGGSAKDLRIPRGPPRVTYDVEIFLLNLFCSVVYMSKCVKYTIK